MNSFDFLLRRTVRRLRARRPASRTTASHPRPEEPPTQFAALGTALVAIGARQVGFGAEALVAAIGPLIGLGEAQARALRAIDRKLDLLLDGPLRGADDYLELARLEHDAERREDWIDRALDRLISAKAHTATSGALAVVLARMGAVAMLQQDTDRAVQHLCAARRATVEELDYLLERANDVRVFRLWHFTWAWIVSVYVPFWVMAKAAKVWRAEAIRPAIEAQLALQRGLEYLERAAGMASLVTPALQDVPGTGRVQLVSPDAAAVGLRRSPVCQDDDSVLLRTTS
jgi:hypothetical protein